MAALETLILRLRDPDGATFIRLAPALARDSTFSLRIVGRVVSGGTGYRSDSIEEMAAAALAALDAETIANRKGETDADGKH